jgi:predicted DNA-binding transcriptional regulator AlpA
MSSKQQGDSSNVIPRTNRIHRVRESCLILGIGRSTYYTLRREGLIAPPIKISRRTRGHTTEYLEELISKMGAA